MVMNVQRKLKREGIPEEDVRHELQEAYDLDSHFSRSPVLYSMCNKPLKIAVDAHMRFIEANLGDPNLYLGTQKLEQSVVNMLLDLLGGDSTMGGKVLAGGTEANITALWIYRNARNANELILPRTAHYSFKTAADMLSLKVKWVEVDDQYRMITEEVEKVIDKNRTVAVVAVAGTTEHGQIDPIPDIQRVCMKEGVPLHVDAAFGGLVFPFLTEVGYSSPYEFGFVLDGVSSITVDPHKMGQATAPAGVLLFRDPKWFKNIEQETFYLSTERLSSILGTRCSAGVASSYAVMRNYGRLGYYRMLETCMKKTEWFARKLKDMGLKLAIEPISPVICVKMPSATKALAVQRRLYEKERKWRVSRSICPPGIRFVMMPHVSEDLLKSFLPEFRDVCKYTQVTS